MTYYWRDVSYLRNKVPLFTLGAVYAWICSEYFFCLLRCTLWFWSDGSFLLSRSNLLCTAAMCCKTDVMLYYKAPCLSALGKVLLVYLKKIFGNAMVWKQRFKWFYSWGSLLCIGHWQFMEKEGLSDVLLSGERTGDHSPLPIKRCTMNCVPEKSARITQTFELSIWIESNWL